MVRSEVLIHFDCAVITGMADLYDTAQLFTIQQHPNVRKKFHTKQEPYRLSMTHVD
jgi:hypothetical protein